MMLAARSPGRFSGLALLNPVPCLAAHRFIRPYVLVWGLSKLHTWVDCTAIAPLWRQALARVWKLWGWRGGVSPKDVSIVHRRLLFVDFEGQPRRSEVLKHAGIPCLVAWAKNDGLIEAFVNSLTIAFVQTIIATILGALTALLLWRFRFPFRGGYEGAMALPIVIPEICMGVAMLAFFSRIGWPTDLPWPLNLSAITIAHVSFSFPFVAVVGRAGTYP